MKIWPIQGVKQRKGQNKQGSDNIGMSFSPLQQKQELKEILKDWKVHLLFKTATTWLAL